FAVGLRNDLAHLALNVVYAVFFHSTAVEFVKVLAGGTNVAIEDGHVHIWIFIPDEHGVFCGVHAADLGAIALAAAGHVTGAHALDEYHFLRRLAVAHALQVPLGWAGSVHDTFQLQRGDNVWALAVG